MQIEKHHIISCVVIFFYFLSWVACCVAFGGPLHTASITIGGYGSISETFSQNMISASGGYGSISYSNSACALPSGSGCSSCQSGGSGLVAVATFCFLITMISIFLRVLHMVKHHHRVPLYGNDLTKYYRLERHLAFATTILLLGMSIIWGATCYNNTMTSGVTVTPTGYALIVICFFFMIIGSALLHYLIRLLVMGANTQTGQPGQPAQYQTNQPVYQTNQPVQYQANQPVQYQANQPVQYQTNQPGQMNQQYQTKIQVAN